MSAKNVFMIIVWAVCTVLALDAGYELLNQKDTLLNIGGVFLLGAIFIISVITRCFTVNPFKK